MGQERNKNSKKTISGNVNKVLFHDARSGRSIFIARTVDGKSCRVIGTIDDIENNLAITAIGSWKKDEKYGWQFLAESIEIISQKEEDFVDDGLIRAIDFSNVLNTKLKEFRNVVLDYKYDNIEHPVGNDKIEQNADEEHENRQPQERKTEIKQREETIVVDGAVYSKDMSKLISGPKNQSHFAIPNTVISIEACAFMDSIIESIHIPDSVKSIKNAAFVDCSKLSTILLPSSVESIGDTVFTGCQSLMTINVDKGNNVFRDINGVLYNHDLSQLIYVPNGLSYVTISESTTTIKYGAFRECNNLNELSIPPSVVNISQHEFGSCLHLLTITINDIITNAGLSKFFNAKQLTTVKLLNSVSQINNTTFNQCSNLVSIEIPASVEVIEKHAFDNCFSLNEIIVNDGNIQFKTIDGVLYNFDATKILYVPQKKTNITLPHSITSITDSIFAGNEQLLSVSIPQSVTSIEHRAFYKCSKLSFIDIPDSVTNIGTEAFSGCSNLRSISIPNSITKIGAGVFRGCTNLSSISIPGSVAKIGAKAFHRCSNLSSISIPSSVTHIGQEAFYGCKGLKIVKIDDVERWCNIKFDYYTSFPNLSISESTFSANPLVYAKHLEINGCEVQNLVIPSSVKQIKDFTFTNCKCLTNITFQKGLTEIGKWAFANCSKLSTITIPDSVTHIGEKAFEGCTGLRNVKINDIGRWCNIDFDYNTNLSNLSIEESAFSANPLVYAKHLELDDCEVKNLIIPNDVSHIKTTAFFNCMSLESIKIPSEVCEIGKLAFYGCNNLLVEILNSQIKIGENAFKGCKCSFVETTVNIDWENVTFLKGYINVPALLGGWTKIKDENVDSSVNSLRKHLAKMMPCLTVHFDQDGIASIVNEKELHDAVITLRIKKDLAALIKEGYHTAEILKRIDGLSPKYIREFIPRDTTPYINFLLSMHAADKYPIVPIVEYIGGNREEGALYTLMIDGQPNIVWENNNDARSTYVFRCTEENYEETRQLVFDYIMAEEIGKRKLLHTDNCMKIFIEKPRMVIHNNFKSWAQRLMCDSELTGNANTIFEE